ncbi:MAG: LysR family transcriptional regulator [Rhodocyclaceae bacterium]|nr:LysR family transcriptional regulator [Rhodocyclaceae bacterium]
MQIDPNDLMIYAAVVEAGSFTRAAAQLGLPKSSVSRRIAALEDELGERLLTRTTRSLTITDFGEGLLAHARRVGEEIDAAACRRPSRAALPDSRFAPQPLHRLPVHASLPTHRVATRSFPRRVDLIGENY